MWSDKMKIKTSSLAVAAAVLLTFCMVFMAPVGAVGSVTVNGETTTYENLTAAANAATAVDSKITYTISGDVEYTAGVSLVKDGATEIIIVGDGYSTSSLTIIGPYHLGYSANGATISFSGLNLTDNRNIGESDAWHFRYIMIDANSVSFTNCLFTEGLLLECDSTFSGCKFDVGTAGNAKGKTDHYSLWLAGDITSSIDNCEFSETSYRGLKLTNNNPDSNPTPVEQTVTISDTTIPQFLGNKPMITTDDVSTLSVTLDGNSYPEGGFTNGLFNSEETNCLESLQIKASETDSGVLEGLTESLDEIVIDVVVSISTPPTTSSSSSGTPTPGAYYNYPRTVTDGGLVEFGTSKVVKSVTLPAGSSGKVNLHIDSTAYWPLAVDSEFTFDISVDNLGVGTSYISFKIAESKLTALDLTAADVGVYHNVNGEWVKLVVTYTIEDGDVIYTAETDSFSPFKLVIEEGAAVQKEEVTPSEPVTPPTEEPTDVPQDIPGEELPDIPDVQDEPETPASPAPVLGLLAALGAAVVLRRK